LIHVTPLLFLLFFFFFQAEDGIRDFHVTGVQTCALPIWALGEKNRLCSTSPMPLLSVPRGISFCWMTGRMVREMMFQSALRSMRSEERRVGKECRSRWWACRGKRSHKQNSARSRERVIKR